MKGNAARFGGALGSNPCALSAEPGALARTMGGLSREGKMWQRAGCLLRNALRGAGLGRAAQWSSWLTWFLQ